MNCGVCNKVKNEENSSTWSCCTLCSEYWFCNRKCKRGPGAKKHEQKCKDNISRKEKDSLKKLPPIPSTKLKFQKGDKVLCNVQSGWEEGEIIDIWQWVPQSKDYAPYVIRILTGPLRLDIVYTFKIDCNGQIREFQTTNIKKILLFIRCGDHSHVLNEYIQRWGLDVKIIGNKLMEEAILSQNENIVNWLHNQHHINFEHACSIRDECNRNVLYILISKGYFEMLDTLIYSISKKIKIKMALYFYIISYYFIMKRIIKK